MKELPTAIYCRVSESGDRSYHETPSKHLQETHYINRDVLKPVIKMLVDLLECQAECSIETLLNNSPDFTKVVRDLMK